MASAYAKNYQFDDDVAKGVQGLIAANSPLMQQANQRGLNTANARGLLNSSIAAGAAQGAVMDRAVPIATATAGFNNAKNLQLAGIAAQGDQQKADIAAQMQRLTTQAGFNKELASMDISARMTMQQKDIAAQANNLKTANDAEMARLTASMANANAQQQKDIQARMDELKYQTSSQLIALDKQYQNASALQSQGSQQQLQNTLAQITAQGDQNMRTQAASIQASMAELQANLAAGDRGRALDAAAGLHSTSQQLIASITANPNIPAAERQKWIQFAQQQASIGLNLVEQIQGVNLNYGQTTGGLLAP
jgi:hypothetical protein